MTTSTVVPGQLPADRSETTGAEAILGAVVFGAQNFLNEPNWADRVEVWFEQLAGAAGAHQVRLFRNDDRAEGEPVSASLVAQWLAPGVRGSPIEAMQRIGYVEAGCGRWLEILPLGGVVADSIAEAPDSELPILRQEGVVSHAIVPVFTDGEWWGFIGFADCENECRWSDAQIHALNAAAGILGAALSRRAMEERLESAAAQAMLATEIGQVLTGSGGGFADALRLSCERILHHLHVDLVRIWTTDPGTGSLHSAYAASTSGDDTCAPAVAGPDSVIGRIAQTRKPESWNGGLPELWPGCARDFVSAGLDIGAGRPLVIDDRVVGVIVVLNRGPLPARAVESLHSITDELALAIERSRAASALSRSEDRYRRLTEATLEGICIHDGKRVHDYNPALARLLAIEPGHGELDPLAFIHDDYKPLAMRNIAEGYTGAYEAVMVRSDGSTFPAEIRGRNYEYDGVTLRVTAIRDLSERKQAEQAAHRLVEEQEAREAAERERVNAQFLAEASRILATSFDTTTTLNQVARLAAGKLAECCFVTLETDGTRLHASAAVASGEKHSAFHHALHDWAAAREDDALVRRQREGLPFILNAAERAAPAAAGAAARVMAELGCTSLMSVPITTGGELMGSIMLASGAGRPPFDVAQLAIAEELGRRAALALQSARSYHEARAATSARDEMLAVVAHDLRNPLNTIYMSSSLALDMASSPDAPEQRQFEIIKRSSEHMNRLIQDLLDASRMQSGQLALELEPIEPRRIVEEAVELMGPLAANAGITFETELADGLDSHVRVDRVRIIQLLSNLIGNALKFTPRGGRITLALRPHEIGMQVAVRDTGSGIPSDQLPHVFGRFWQARRTDRRGLGLGLGIARGIVEAHGGSIWVTSEPGVGSEFVFTVPRTPTG